MIMTRNIKNLINRIFAIALTICILAGLLLCATNVCERKDAKFRLTSFFANTDQIDVLYYGSSHMINGVYPNYMWRDYGITGYNFASHADYFGSTYWAMMNSLDYASPKLIVIDCYTIADMYKVCGYEYLHGWMDAMPLTPNKIKAVWDLTDDPLREAAIEIGELEEDSRGTKGEFLWDFCKYHSRWNEITDESFKTPVATERGAEARINVMPMEDTEKISPDDIYETEAISVSYLKKMIEECQSRGIEVLLVYIPYSAPDYRQRQANFAGQIASEYGLNYVNFLNESVVDYSVDFYDDTHLNSSGAEKITDYLGRYIRDNYNLEDHRDDAAYAHFYDEYEDYKYYMRELFVRQDKPENALLMLKSRDYDSVIEINNEAFWDNEICVNLMRNMSSNADDMHGLTGYFVKHGWESTFSYSENIPDEYGYIYEQLAEEAQADSPEAEVAESIHGCGVRFIMVDAASGEYSQKTF